MGFLLVDRIIFCTNILLVHILNIFDTINSTKSPKGEPMYATEFQTIIDNPYIKIPEYEKFKGQEVRIIVLNINQENGNPKIAEEDFIEYLANHPVTLDKGVEYLSREESNER